MHESRLSTTRRWEHLIITLSEELDADWDTVRDTLDRYGEEGWELVTYAVRPIVDIRGGIGLSNLVLSAGSRVDATHAESFAIFKRLKPA